MSCLVADHMAFVPVREQLLEMSAAWRQFCTVYVEPDRLRMTFFSTQFEYMLTLLDDMYFQVVVRGCPVAHCWFSHRVRFGRIICLDATERAQHNSAQVSYTLGEFLWCVRLYAERVGAHPGRAKPGVVNRRLRKQSSPKAECETV